LAYEYKTNNTEKSMKLKAYPYRCVIAMNSSNYGYCIKLNKNGKPLKSGKIDIWSRKYADTKEEAILEYNKLIDNQINFLKSLILDCEQHKLGIK